jgi:predicted nuclease of predicted toxin-antitoxin system
MGWVNLIELVRANPPKKTEIEQVLKYRRQKAKARFYADENFPLLATQILRSMKARVITVQEIGARKHADENHPAYALKNGLVLLTCDRDYLDERRFPLIHCPTIIVLDFGSGSHDEICQSFTCLKRILSTPQFFDKWTKIDACRAWWTEYSRTLDGATSRSRYRVWRGKIQEWVEDWPTHVQHRHSRQHSAACQLYR